MYPKSVFMFATYSLSFGSAVMAAALAYASIKFSNVLITAMCVAVIWFAVAAQWLNYRYFSHFDQMS